MAAAVLGKRTRTSAFAEESNIDLPTRSKRRTRASPKATTGDNAFNIHQDLSAGADGASGTQSQNAQQNDQHAAPLAPSPSKGNAVSPRTPRHRDALSKKQIVTPRHRVSVAGVPFTPRTPQTPTSETRRSNATRSVFGEARRLFSKGSHTGPLIGRQKERQELDEFVAEAVRTRSGGCLYVSGPPGTGKSALVGDVCDSLKQSGEVNYAYLNCMSVKSAADVYSHLVSELGVSDDVFGSQAKDTLLSACLSRTERTRFLVVLDEVDQLLELDLRILYSLFESALEPSSRLVLIGIANALDLTDRFLPQLKARNLKPRLLPFLPYSALDIASILSSRARSLLPLHSSCPADFTPFLTHQAIQLVSKKVAAQTGDLRKAFDITQKIIDVVETEARDKMSASKSLSDSSPVRAPLGENGNLSSPRSPEERGKVHAPAASLASLTFETAPRATLSHVLRVTNATFAASSTTSRLKSLNLQQKAALCSMAALEARKQRKLQFQLELEKDESEQSALPSPTETPRAKRIKFAPAAAARPNANNATLAAPTIREVYDAYGTLCRTENVLHALSLSEFRDVIGNLETAGLVSGVDGRGSLVQVAPATPSRKGRGGSSAAMGVRVEDCKIKGTASTSELESVLEGAGCEILKRMLRGDDI